MDYSTNVPRPIYTEPQTYIKSPSPPASSTASAITENIVHELNVIEKEFIPDKAYLHQDFFTSHNLEKRRWFFKYFLNKRKAIQNYFYDFIYQNKVNILFFEWFEIYASENNIFYPFKVINPVTFKKSNSLRNSQ